MSEQPAAGWYVDPTHRFEHRYWDGTTWTEHVSRNGQATTDPLDGSASSSDDDRLTAGDPASGTMTTPQHSQVGDTGPAPTWSAGTGGGTPWQDQARGGARTNTKAIVSLVLSLIWFGGLTAVAGIIVGTMAKREIRERPDEGGSGIATAGIIIGVVGVVGAAIMFLFALMMIAGSSTTTFSGTVIG